jgi:hypothetical protein
VWYASDPQLNNEDMMAKMLKFTKYFPAEGSNLERQTKSISGHEKALREGRYTLPPKPGYMKGDLPGVHIPSSTEFSYLQKALREIAAGVSTPTNALKELNESNFTKNRSQWKMDKFRKYATDPYYAGIVEKDRQVKARSEAGLHEPMLTMEEHRRIIEAFSQSPTRKYDRKGPNPLFPLNRSFCNCGGKLVGANHKNGKGWACLEYRCLGCSKLYKETELHDSLTALLTRVRLSQDDRKQFVKALQHVWVEHQRSDLARVTSLEAQKTRLTVEKERAARSYSTVPDELKEDIAGSIAKIKVEIEVVDQELSKASNIADDLVSFVEFALNFTHDLSTEWWDLDIQEKFQCKNLLFPGDLALDENGKVYTPQLSDIYRLAGTKKDPRMSRESLMVELAGLTPASERIIRKYLQA